jgi:hypothetical protein
MQLLTDPVSAEDACWLLSFRDRLYGPATAINIEDLPWSVKVTDWDILQCKAIPTDIPLSLMDMERLPIEDFCRQYCGTLTFALTRPLDIWRIQLRRANLKKTERVNYHESETVISTTGWSPLSVMIEVAFDKPLRDERCRSRVSCCGEIRCRTDICQESRWYAAA